MMSLWPFLAEFVKILIHLLRWKSLFNFLNVTTLKFTKPSCFIKNCASFIHAEHLTFNSESQSLS